MGGFLLCGGHALDRLDGGSQCASDGSHQYADPDRCAGSVAGAGDECVCDAAARRDGTGRHGGGRTRRVERQYGVGGDGGGDPAWWRGWLLPMAHAAASAALSAEMALTRLAHLV